MKNLPCPATLAGNDVLDKYDCAILLAVGIEEKHFDAENKHFFQVLNKYKQVDNAVNEEVSVHAVENGAIKKLIYSPIGPLNRDYDDVRCFYDAACHGMKRALKSGCKNPLLIIPKDVPGQFERYEVASILGALESLYVPLEIREDVPSKAKKADTFGVAHSNRPSLPNALKLALAVESGRSTYRDIGGSDPERMAPPRVAEYVKTLFAGSVVRVEVTSDEHIIEKSYPLLAAVNRAARGIERHRARVILLTYEPEGPVDTTILLVGKGVTYDTGGADIKAGGIMAGMHRDKCGSAAVAGFFQVLAELKPKGVKVLGAMAMVRNSVGSDCYVADELITSRAGVRIRVGNTDAEGRMAMADLLCYMKEKAVYEVNPHIFTIATLTGHAVLTVGHGYSIIMDNGPAKNEMTANKIQKAGDSVGDMFEISTIRREDYAFAKGKSEYEDLLQCNNAPSSRTPRGHQFPAAFMIMASGLDKHGQDSSKPLKYSHIDIAAADGPFPGIPSGSPIAALSAHFLFGRI